MADNELSVVSADTNVRKTRDLDLGDDGTGQHVHLQAVVVGEGLLEQPVSTTGGAVQYTVTSAGPTALDPPNVFAIPGDGARYCRLRVFDTSWDPATAATQNKRLYYLQDGTTVSAAAAHGYLLHGESMLVRLADFTDFRMIAESSSWKVYAEWLTIPPKQS